MRQDADAAVPATACSHPVGRSATTMLELLASAHITSTQGHEQTIKQPFVGAATPSWSAR